MVIPEMIPFLFFLIDSQRQLDFRFFFLLFLWSVGGEDGFVYNALLFPSV